MSYEDRTEPLTVNLADPGPDGAEGEGDLLMGIEAVHSGHGDDRITGTSGPNQIEDEGGDNRISGMGGSDEFRVTSGRVDCGSGTDAVRGVTQRALLLPSCETVLAASEDSEFFVRAYPRPTSEGLQMRMRCGVDDDAVPIRCSGTVTIATRSRVLARGTLGPGRGNRIAVLRPTAAGRRILDGPVAATIAIRGPGLPDISWGVRLGAPAKD